MGFSDASVDLCSLLWDRTNLEALQKKLEELEDRPLPSPALVANRRKSVLINSLQ